MLKKYLAFDVGCIECGEGSAVVGVFNSQEEAQSAADNARERQSKDWTGEHHFQVFPIEI